MSELSLATKLPERPNPVGIPLGLSKNVITNFYELKTSKEQQIIYVHSVILTPEIPPDDRIRKYKIMYSLIQQLLKKEACKWCIFLNNQFFSTEAFKSLEVENAKCEDGSEYKINIKITDYFEIGGIFTKQRKIIQVLTAVLKDCMRKLNYQQINRSSAYFNNETIEDFKKYWEIFRGYHVPCRVIEKGLAIQIALKTKLIAKYSALDRIKEIMEQYTSYVEKVKQEIIGRSVRAVYGNNRHWKITDIDFTKNPLSTFEHEKKGKISFAKYYLETYQVKVIDIKQPLLVSKVKRGTMYLIPELVNLTGLSESEVKKYRSELNERLVLDNEIRVNQASLLAKKLQSIKTPLNFTVTSNPIIVEANLMDPPKIFLGEEGSATITSKDRDFTIEGKLYEPAKYKQWVCILDKSDDEFIGGLLKVMFDRGNMLGIELVDPAFVYFAAENWEQELGGLFKSFGETFEFSLFVMPSSLNSIKQRECYKYVKRLAYKDYPILNQVVKTTILTKKYQSKVEKLLVGINAKMGKAPWRVRMFKLEPTMVFGLDICHSKESGVNKSYLGFCATMNEQFNSLYSIAYELIPGQDLMDGLNNCILSAITELMGRKKTLPKLLIFYRDGISESHFNVVIDSEVKQVLKYIPHIREKLGLQIEQWDPKIIYIIVNKRVNIRLFEYNNNYDILTSRSGTLVAKDITSQYYDFYLISQRITQGAAIPTHYIVIYDDAKIEAEKIYHLTYRLCFLDYNWMGGVRVPAPCQYAHKVAFMAANNVEGTPSSSLASKLYFI